jgi:hypothetical protein
MISLMMVLKGRDDSLLSRVKIDANHRCTSEVDEGRGVRR